MFLGLRRVIALYVYGKSAAKIEPKSAIWEASIVPLILYHKSSLTEQDLGLVYNHSIMKQIRDIHDIVWERLDFLYHWHKTFIDTSGMERQLDP